MGGKDAPNPDFNIGVAAMKSAQTGEDYLGWMKKQAEITNRWADEDRTRSKTIFEPLQDDYIEIAKGWDSPERQQTVAGEAKADVMRSAAEAKAASQRSMAAMGVNPNSGRYAGVEREADIDTALASAGAQNTARNNVRLQGMEMKGNAVNMGAGLAVNPLSSIATSNGAMSAGANGAMQGYQQQGQLLTQDYESRMKTWQANQAGASAGFSALGGIMGLAFGSDEDIKEDKEPAEGSLDAVKNMPVEEWTYKEGEGDGGRHIGTYAQDFQRETGKGDGKSINVIDAIGVTMGAVKELAEQVDEIAASVGAEKKVKTKSVPGVRGRGVMAEELA